MRTLRFLATITIVCCAFMACEKVEGDITPANDVVYYVTPIEEVSTAGILRDFIKVEDDYAILDIDRESAEKLGVKPENFDFFKTNIEKTNALVQEYKKYEPDLIINWVFESEKDGVAFNYNPNYQTKAQGAEARAIPSGGILSEGGNWSYSPMFFLDGNYNCFLCNCSAVPPASSYEVRTVFNNTECLTMVTIDDYNNTSKTFYAPVAANNASGQIEFKANAVSGFLGYGAAYQQIQGISQ